jgi:hypothetical protein
MGMRAAGAGRRGPRLGRLRAAAPARRRRDHRRSTRATGLLPNGLTGLSTKDTTGVADLHWSGWAIHIYFLAGGIIFGLLVVHYRAQHAHSRRRTSCLR